MEVETLDKYNKITNNNDKSNDEETYINNIDSMNFMFPKLRFSSDPYDYDRLHKELLPYKIAFIKHPLKCIVCCPKRKGHVAIIVKNKFNTNITYYDFYKCCEKQWKRNLCNHCFLENISTKDNLLILTFGS